MKYQRENESVPSNSDFSISSHPVSHFEFHSDPFCLIKKGEKIKGKRTAPRVFPGLCAENQSENENVSDHWTLTFFFPLVLFLALL